RVGAAPSTPATTLMEALAAMQLELEDYNSNTPAELEAAVPDLQTKVNDEREEVTDFISANNIQEFAMAPSQQYNKTIIKNYQEMVSKYVAMTNAEATFWTSLMALKTHLELHWQAHQVLLATQNGPLIAQHQLEGVTLTRAYWQLVAAHQSFYVDMV